MATQGKVDPKKVKKEVNVTHQNAMHAEKIYKEMKHFGKNVNEQFQLNPHNTYILPDKTTSYNPHGRVKKYGKGEITGTYTEDPVEEAFSNERIQKSLLSVNLVPRQKFDHPMTANQEFGWYATQMSKQTMTQDHKLKSNPITQFADEYFCLKKINPFKVR